MQIGENIREARTKQGLTQKELGEKMGVSNTMIAAWEIGNRNPKVSTVHRIAEALGCKPNEIFRTGGRIKDVRQDKVITQTINIYTSQVNLFDDTPMTHLNHCHEGKCPSGDRVCCFECGDRTCRDRCDRPECHVEKIRQRYFG